MADISALNSMISSLRSVKTAGYITPTLLANVLQAMADAIAGCATTDTVDATAATLSEQIGSKTITDVRIITPDSDTLAHANSAPILIYQGGSISGRGEIPLANERHVGLMCPHDYRKLNGV